MRQIAGFASLVAMGLVVVSACAAGDATMAGGAPGTPSATTATPTLVVTSPVMADGGTLPVRFTCDGTATTPPLAWSGAPAGTVGYAIVMHTQPPEGGAHWYWVLYDIAPEVDHLDENAVPPATAGTNSVNGANAYAPPCSKGPGPKAYTFTVYALSGQPDLPDRSSVSRVTLLDAIDGLVLAEAHLDVTYART
jgi:phosphatidylethanolamine-binding protein (PEBP) family uncharacterized protein